ncbi:MAG: sigma-70 family RNA polymerase sigma factor [Pseudomonadales bacterium]|nr:sigma-70 family RNA polymerase sigma factor [Pseudomonadales bacterium]
MLHFARSESGVKKFDREPGSDRAARDSEDVALLQRVATKDRMAFESLYARYYPQLSRYLIRLMRRPELVEEVVNDTLFVVWQKAGDFQGRSRVSTWITGIAYLKGIKALDRLRTMPEQHAEHLSDAEDIEESRNLINKLGIDDWLASGLDRISVDQRSVVELTYFSGFSYQEIADIMDCPVNTVKTRMFHARRRLAKLLPLLEEQTLTDGEINEKLT